MPQLVEATGHTGHMTEDLLALISTDPQVMHGQVVVTGTRVTVSVILDCLADGMPIEDILAQYPTLSRDSVRAAAAYGALLARDEIVPLQPAP